MKVSFSNNHVSAFMNMASNKIEFYYKDTFSLFEKKYNTAINGIFYYTQGDSYESTRVCLVDEYLLNKENVFSLSCHRTDLGLLDNASKIKLSMSRETSSINMRGEELVKVSIPIVLNKGVPYIDTTNPVIVVIFNCHSSTNYFLKSIYFVDWHGDYEIIKNVFLTDGKNMDDYEDYLYGFYVRGKKRTLQNFSITVKVSKDFKVKSDTLNKNITVINYKNTAVQLALNSDIFVYEKEQYRFTWDKKDELFTDFYAPLGAVRLENTIYFLTKGDIVYEKNYFLAENFGYNILYQVMEKPGIDILSKHMYIEVKDTVRKLHYLKEDVYLYKILSFQEYLDTIYHTRRSIEMFEKEFDVIFERKRYRQIPFETKEEYINRLVWKNKDFLVRKSMAENTPHVCSTGVAAFIDKAYEFKVTENNEDCITLENLWRFRWYRDEVKSVIEYVLFYVLAYTRWDKKMYTPSDNEPPLEDLYKDIEDKEELLSFLKSPMLEVTPDSGDVL